MKHTRSPINLIPLRNPGEALLQRRMLMVMEQIGIWIIALGIAGIFTAIEWIRWFREVPPRPYVSTALFLILGTCVVIHTLSALRKIRNYDLGLLGERYMGERLSELYADGYHIIHDVPCGRMNIDHVLIGPAGIFTIETKMARKEVDQLNEITHTDKGVLMNGKRGWAGKAVWEARKEVEYLQDILNKDGGTCPPIQPIVVYPGWYVTDDCSRNVWVLNDRYLVKKIRSLPSGLSPDNMKNVRRKIEAYARKQTEETDYTR